MNLKKKTKTHIDLENRIYRNEMVKNFIDILLEHKTTGFWTVYLVQVVILLPDLITGSPANFEFLVNNEYLLSVMYGFLFYLQNLATVY